MTYMQTMYDSIPESIEILNLKLEKENAQNIFHMKRLDSMSPSTIGFELVCADIHWHCFWDGISDYISITEDDKMRPGINRINYAATRAAQKIVQDIHREKLMRMPENSATTIEWIETMTGKKFEPL
ncbi:MAG: hypothetical protein JST89_14030 [Cyanobacteria bacterium SZAS-4]|nr:hypothetical protein [Cyanobacteria bacterium SZAS-4]